MCCAIPQKKVGCCLFFSETFLTEEEKQLFGRIRLCITFTFKESYLGNPIIAIVHPYMTAIGTTPMIFAILMEKSLHHW